MKFKVGEKVRVRKDLRAGEKYGNRLFSGKMELSKGETFTIDYADENDYLLEGSTWWWTDEMLEPAEERNCDTCKNYGTGFICCQCCDFDEWEQKDESGIKIILISGKAQHGKDSVAKMLFDKLTSQGNKVLIAHYGDLLKYTCKTFFGWNGEKDEQGRKILQEVGTDRIRAKIPNIWVDYIKNIISVCQDKWDYVIIPDTRFPNEIDVMKDTFDNVVSIRAIRTNFISPLTEEQQGHKSETALDDYQFDYYLVADNLEQLEKRVENYLKSEVESEN